MKEASERVIRERAHRLWESEGRPEGKHDEHWRRASEEIHGLEDLPETNDDDRLAAAAPEPVRVDVRRKKRTT
jgi:hypothetical protein